MHNQQLSFKDNCDVGDSERSKKGSVTFNKVHVTTQIEAARPQWPTVTQEASFTHAFMDHSSRIPFLLALVRGAVLSVKCGYRQQFTEYASLFGVCWWDTGNGSGTVYPSPMLNAIPGAGISQIQKKYSF